MLKNEKVQQAYYTSSSEQIISNLFSTTLNGNINVAIDNTNNVNFEDKMDLKAFFEDFHINFIHLMHYFSYAYKDICPDLYYYYYRIFTKHDYSPNVFVYKELLEDNVEEVFNILESVLMYYDFGYSIVESEKDKYVELVFTDKYDNKHNLKLYCMLDVLIFAFIFSFMIGGDSSENDEL